MKNRLSKNRFFLLLNLLLFICFSTIYVPARSAENQLNGIRGSFFDFVDDPWKHVGHDEEAARFYQDGLLVLDNGIIKAFGSYGDIAPKYPGLKVTNIP